MLQKLKALFADPEQAAEPSQHDVELAAASLMFELIKSDGQVDPVEMEKLAEILKSKFNLDSQSIEELVQQAQKSVDEAISLHGFTRKICETWNNEQRVMLLESLWMLALADQRIDAHERHLVRKVAGLLYLTDRQINLAKESAISRMA